MRIEVYFRRMQRAIENCGSVSVFDLHFEKRGTHEGFLKGRLIFVDSSVLEFRKFMDTESKIDRLMYTYHYQDAKNKLIFRYDNTGHHKKLKLPTYPHHKHEGDEMHVVRCYQSTGFAQSVKRN